MALLLQHDYLVPKLRSYKSDGAKLTGDAATLHAGLFRYESDGDIAPARAQTPSETSESESSAK